MYTNFDESEYREQLAELQTLSNLPEESELPYCPMGTCGNRTDQPDVPCFECALPQYKEVVNRHGIRRLRSDEYNPFSILIAAEDALLKAEYAEVRMW